MLTTPKIKEYNMNCKKDIYNKPFYMLKIISIHKKTKIIQKIHLLVHKFSQL